MSSSSRPSGDHRCSSGLRHDDDAIRPSVTGRQAGATEAGHHLHHLQVVGQVSHPLGSAFGSGLEAK